MRKIAIGLGLLIFLTVSGQAQQVNPFLVPERVESRINASVEIARQLKNMGYNRIAVVYMETSDLCALFSASLVASLKTLGVEAYYVKGGEGLEERLRLLQPLHIYMAYFGDRPYSEVQSQFNQDLKRVFRYQKRPSLVLQPSLLELGFVSGTLADGDLSSALENLPMLSFVFEGGKARPARVVIKDLEVKVSVEQPQTPTKPQAPTRQRKR